MARKTKCCSPESNSAQEEDACNDASIISEQRCCMIAEAAYFRAKKRDFAGDDPVQD